MPGLPGLRLDEMFGDIINKSFRRSRNPFSKGFLVVEDKRPTL